MNFRDEVKANKDLFRALAAGRRLGVKEREQLDEIKRSHGIREDGTVRTQKDLAELMGVTRQTVIRWIKEGMPLEPDGSYDPVRVIEWRADVSGDPGDAPDLTEKSFWEGEFRKYRAKMAELDYQRALGELIPRADVEQLLVERATELKKSLLSRARRLGSRLANRDAKSIQEILADDTMEILRVYSRPNHITGGRHAGGEDPAGQVQGADAVREVPAGEDGVKAPTGA